MAPNITSRLFASKSALSAKLAASDAPRITTTALVARAAFQNKMLRQAQSEDNIRLQREAGLHKTSVFRFPQYRRSILSKRRGWVPCTDIIMPVAFKLCTGKGMRTVQGIKKCIDED
ncbi:hypothetical protein FOL47_000565 [Perkinsus chesapeaki]|uniref:Uncharacterized protein n=1 Tax=Perkinsus chesapeaki TaxID=330153 RepID=A0A7J6N2E3_PERCH|nr:hypothetical protein FOL47_000565 [Perkinsus chesapeaki]